MPSSKIIVEQQRVTLEEKAADDAVKNNSYTLEELQSQRFNVVSPNSFPIPSYLMQTVRSSQATTLTAPTTYVPALKPKSNWMKKQNSVTATTQVSAFIRRPLRRLESANSTLHKQNFQCFSNDSKRIILLLQLNGKIKKLRTERDALRQNLRNLQ